MKYTERKLGRYRKGVYKTKRGFPAKYKGMCFMCERVIKVGDQIDRTSTNSYYHVACEKESSPSG